MTLLLLGALGCSSPGTKAAQEITPADPALATPAHWLAQPAVATVAHDDYDELWQTCQDAARWYGFRTDRADYRGGLLVSLPLVSKQAFELWRRDVNTVGGVAESTLATVRRTVRFEIVRANDGAFICTPKVLVERYASSERRITSVTQYRETFSIRATEQGSRERDEGTNLPQTYWYATGRDHAMERRLAASLTARLARQVARR